MRLDKRSDLRLDELMAVLTPEPWAKLLELCGSEAEAITAMEAPCKNGKYSQKEYEPHFMLVLEMLDKFQELAKCGELEFTGIFSGNNMRQPIPADLFDDVWWFWFKKGTLATSSYGYTHIKASVGHAPSRNLLVSELVKWLGNRLQGKSLIPKKVLQAEAEAVFGRRFKVRAFNEAYTQHFGFTRGRPRTNWTGGRAGVQRAARTG